MRYTISACTVNQLVPNSPNGMSAGFVLAAHEGFKSKHRAGVLVLQSLPRGRPPRLDPKAFPALAPMFRVTEGKIVDEDSGTEVEMSNGELQRLMTGYPWHNRVTSPGSYFASVHTSEGPRLVRFEDKHLKRPELTALIPLVIQSIRDPLAPIAKVLSMKSEPEPATGHAPERGVLVVSCTNGIYSVTRTRPSQMGRDMELDERVQALQDFTASVRFVVMPQSWNADVLARNFVVSRPSRDAILLSPEDYGGEAEGLERSSVAVKLANKQVEVRLSRGCLSDVPAESAGSLWGLRSSLPEEAKRGYVFLEQPLVDWQRSQYTQRYSVEIIADGDGSVAQANHRRRQLKERRGISATLTCDVYYPRLRAPQDTETEDSLVSAMVKIVSEGAETVVAATLGVSCPGSEEDVRSLTEGLSQEIAAEIAAAGLFDGAIAVRVRFECIETEGAWLPGSECTTAYKIPSYASRANGARLLVQLAVMQALGFRAEFFPWSSTDTDVSVSLPDEGIPTELASDSGSDF